MRILILFPGTPEEVVHSLRAHADVVGPLDVGQDWQTPFRTCDAIITVVQPQFTGAVLDQAPALRVIGRPGIGVDNVDLAAATARGIAVVNTPDAPTEPVAEKVVGWIIMLAHRLGPADRVARAPGWQGREHLMGNDLVGKTLGLIGVGRVGSRVAGICAEALGMRVLAYDPYASAERMSRLKVELVPHLDQLLTAADFISIHCPLTAETRGLLGEAQLRRLKRTAYVINSARFGVLDEEAFVRALREGWLAGAALDVLPSEPPPPDHPLLHMDQVLLAPHFSSFTHEGMFRMLQETADQVLAVLRGERPPNLVNPDVWDKRKS